MLHSHPQPPALPGDNPWHPCPSPQFVVTLAGAWYINTTDGDYIEFNAGDLLYQDDSKGLIVSGVEPVHYSGIVGNKHAFQTKAK
eukprot:1259718-Amphidinium_carterae.1